MPSNENYREVGRRIKAHQEALDQYFREHCKPDPPEGYPQPTDPTTKPRGRRSLKGLHKPRDQK